MTEQEQGLRRAGDKSGAIPMVAGMVTAQHAANKQQKGEVDTEEEGKTITNKTLILFWGNCL